MDSYSSGEEPVVKTRKPYTITKQRERWTEEEHSMFLEALKLYGRAWPRIEEHIGSKTAVQIRSHAQKFFTKLEKEALIKGIPVGQALDIEIPPPRPKRKPINPYPRSQKTASCNLVAKDRKLSAADSSLCQSKQPPCQDKEPLLEKPSDDEKLDIANENREDVISDMLTLFQAGSTSPSVGNRDSVPTEVTTFRGFVPIVNGGGSIQDDGNRSYVTIEATHKLHTKHSFQDGSSCSSPGMGNSLELEEKLGYGERIAESNQPGGIIRENDMRRYPRHVPVQILDESSWINTNNRHHTLSNTYQHQSNPSIPSVHHIFPNFNPMVTSNCNSNHYGSCLHISSAFSSLIVSALLQNPAAHAAASVAASSLWPCSNVEAPTDSALAAVTVAAATAWWAANGLLPICSPFHNTSFTYPTPSTTTMPMDSTCHTKAGNNERKDETPDHLHAQEQVTGSLEQAARVTVLVDSNTEEKNKKLVDRSSCGSNTPSSSEIETDALENLNKYKQDPKDPYHINHTPTDSGNRRGKSNSNINDPWKEVSEEGRIAFRALFSREVLPQSFSRPHNSNSTAKVYSEQNRLHIDLSDKSSRACPNHSGNMDESPFGGENMLALKLGDARLNARRTGFKPYKRCSVEAKDSRVTSTSYHHHQDDEEKVSKRVRLGGGGGGGESSP